MTLALKELCKYIEINESMENVFKSLNNLENRIENNVLNKNKQYPLDQLFIIII